MREIQNDTKMPLFLVFLMYLLKMDLSDTEKLTGIGALPEQ